MDLNPAVGFSIFLIRQNEICRVFEFMFKRKNKYVVKHERGIIEASSGSFYCAHPIHTPADTECHSQDCKSAELSEFGSLKLESEFPISNCHQLLYISKDWSSYNTTLRLKSSCTSYTVSSVEYKKLTSLSRDARHLT
uniref:Uncharacterized protein n=1 Tax=Trichogramma kaykai TaxID=54128 RepID=A0ABD2X5P3_9HYME